MALFSFEKQHMLTAKKYFFKSSQTRELLLSGTGSFKHQNYE